MTKIVAPAGKAAAGKQLADGVVFDADGVAHTDNGAVVAYARRKGYGIDDDPPTYQPPDLTPRDERGNVVDSRFVETRHLNGYPELREVREAERERDAGYRGQSKGRAKS